MGEFKTFLAVRGLGRLVPKQGTQVQSLVEEEGRTDGQRPAGWTWRVCESWRTHRPRHPEGTRQVRRVPAYNSPLEHKGRSKWESLLLRTLGTEADCEILGVWATSPAGGPSALQSGWVSGSWLRASLLKADREEASREDPSGLAAMNSLSGCHLSPLEGGKERRQSGGIQRQYQGISRRSSGWESILQGGRRGLTPVGN